MTLLVQKFGGTSVGNVNRIQAVAKKIAACKEAGNDIVVVPLMCVMCVALPFVLVTIAPRFITAAEVNLFFLLETIIGPIWVWLVIKEQPTPETILGGLIIIITIAIHSFIKIKNSQV